MLCFPSDLKPTKSKRFAFVPIISYDIGTFVLPFRYRWHYYFSPPLPPHTNLVTSPLNHPSRISSPTLSHPSPSPSSPHFFPSSHLFHLLLTLSSSSCSSSNSPFLNLHPLPSLSLIPSTPLSPLLVFTLTLFISHLIPHSSPLILFIYLIPSNPLSPGLLFTPHPRYLSFRLLPSHPFYCSPFTLFISHSAYPPLPPTGIHPLSHSV
jgi:hypothetical protein